jgi:hypothetical protein
MGIANGGLDEDDGNGGWRMASGGLHEDDGNGGLHENPCSNSAIRNSYCLGNMIDNGFYTL